MLRRSFVQLPAAAAFAQGALPDFYTRVWRVLWVIDDIARLAARWRALGLDVDDRAEAGERLELADATWHGRREPTSIRFRTASIGGALITWIAPEGPKNAFAEFREQNRGNGVMSLMYGVPTPESYRAEVRRLKELAPALMEATVQTGDSSIPFALFDTRKEGKYALGLIQEPEIDLQPPVPTRRVTQFAFIANDLEKVSAYWARFGFPAMTYSHPDGRDSVYRGRPGVFDMRLGWQRHTPVPFEWIQPLKGPSTYREHLEKHGEGFHHFAFSVPDMDQAVAEWAKAGYAVSMSGAWGQKDQPGSGRFAYVDTSAIGGITIELLWNYRKPA